MDRQLIANLPQGFQMKLKEVGDKCTIVDNYHSTMACLSCSTTRTTQMLETLFADHALVIRSRYCLICLMFDCLSVVWGGTQYDSGILFEKKNCRLNLMVDLKVYRKMCQE